MTLVLDQNGKPVLEQRIAPCPKCGAEPNKRVPSSGFGIPHLICSCGYEFEGKLLCPVGTL